MDLVEVRLNSFLYRFRRLSWVEESSIKVTPGKDQYTVYLIHSLHDVSGLPVPSLEDAERIILAIPRTFRWRVWVIYRGSLTPDRTFVMSSLYDAPEPQVYNKRLVEDEQASDPVFDAVAQKHGSTEASEAHALGQKMLENAVKSRKDQVEKLARVKTKEKVRGTSSRASTSFVPVSRGKR
jgi:hypothetical protein